RGVALGLAFLAVASHAEAGPLADAMRERQKRIDTLLAPFPGDVPRATRLQLQQTLVEAFDIPAMAQAALGREWEPRGPAERDQYASAFERLLRAYLVRRVD